MDGYEVNASLGDGIHTINGAAYGGGNDRAYVAYTTTQDPGSQNVNLLSNISTNDTEAGMINGAIPPGGGKCALALTAPQDSHIEFLSPPNLLDGGASNIHGTGGKGLKRMGFRFFYRAPEAFEEGKDQLCRFWDGDLGRLFSDAGGNKIEDGSPLFRLSFKNDAGNNPSKAGLYVKTHDNGSILGQTTQSCFNVSAAGTPSWHQIAITVVVGGAAGENPQDSDGLLVINVDGVDVVTINAEIQFPSTEEAPAAQAIEYYSFLTSNTDANEGSAIRTLFDNVVVYDHWQPGQSPDFSDLQGTIAQTTTLNQVIQGVYPVNESGGEGGNDDTNEWGNWKASDGSAALGNATSHLAIQGDDNFTPTDPNLPENPISYAGDTYLKTNDIGENSKYTVDTWDRDMVDAAWDSKIGEIRAIRVINVCKFTEASNETVQLTFKAPPTNGAAATGDASMSKGLAGTDFQIVSAVFDQNPDGNGDGNPGPLIPNGNPADRSFVIDSMRIGLKVDTAGGGG